MKYEITEKDIEFKIVKHQDDYSLTHGDLPYVVASMVVKKNMPIYDLKAGITEEIKKAFIGWFNNRIAPVVSINNFKCVVEKCDYETCKNIGHMCGDCIRNTNLSDLYIKDKI